MNTKPHLILTVDYELFGNGSGCVKPCILEPAENMLKIADLYSAKITFFADAIEFMKMEQEKEYYEDIVLVKNQLSGSVRGGHDVQLHVHPQWIQSEYTNYQWNLDLTAWRIADLQQDEIISVFNDSIDWLTNAVCSDNKHYICNTFRAGGWCIQPSDKVIKAMQKTGITMDSTVAPGFKNISNGEWSNFSNVPQKPFWYSALDVCCESKNGIMEIPIATGKIEKLKHLQVLKAAKKQGMAQGCGGSYLGPDDKFQQIKGKFGKLFRLGNVMLDFSTMTSEVLIEITQQWLEKYSHIDEPLPIVAIAHTKNFTRASEIALNDYLSWAKNEGFIFSTYTDWQESLNG